MIRVVLDTNVIVSAIIGRRYSPSLEIFESFKSHKFILATSVAILEEIEEVLNRERIIKFHGFNLSKRSKIIINLAKSSSIVPDTSVIEVVQDDPDDNKILVCAFEAEASYIVTGDRHLLKLKKFKGTKIVTPREFKDILNREIL